MHWTLAAAALIAAVSAVPPPDFTAWSQDATAITGGPAGESTGRPDVPWRQGRKGETGSGPPWMRYHDGSESGEDQPDRPETAGDAEVVEDGNGLENPDGLEATTDTASKTSELEDNGTETTEESSFETTLGFDAFTQLEDGPTTLSTAIHSNATAPVAAEEPGATTEAFTTDLSGPSQVTSIDTESTMTVQLDTTAATGEPEPTSAAS